jgi:LmbE family N-acetylglucosaminyl deacetylase
VSLIHDSVPELFAPPNGPVLFCLTHPDDEISICVTIKRMVEAGVPTYLSWTHHTPIRKAEALAFAARVGVPEERTYFHDGTDGDVCLEMTKLLPSFERMIAEVRPDRVYAGAFEQGHLDHDATHRMVYQAFGSPLIEIPFYYSYYRRYQQFNRFSESRGEQILTLSHEERLFKRQVARSYPSQNIWRLLVAAEVVETVLGRRPFLDSTERVRLQSHFDYRSPNHSTLLKHRIQSSKSWEKWMQGLEAFEESLQKVETLARS